MSMNHTNIYFDYDGYYSRKGDEYKWISRNSIYAISFKTSSLEEITYSVLVDKIYKKIAIDKITTKLKLSYIPLVVNPQRESSILDDEDVFVYLTTLDETQLKSVLHVEVIKDLEINQTGEQLSRAERGGSLCGNYVEPVSNGRAGMQNIFRADATEQNTEPIIEEPHRVEESQYVEEWEDGTGLEIGQEFSSKEAVQDLVDKASHKNCFAVATVKSDTKRLMLRCRQANEGCKWYVRVAKIKTSNYWGVRVYRKVHTCSRAVTITSNNRKKGTPRLVASILHEDYPGQFDTPAPKNIMSIVQGRLGVRPSYSTALRGEKLAASDVRGNPEKGYKMLYSYLYMLRKVNPGTITSVKLDAEKKFKYLFIALGASIEGFKAMQKVIVVDATFLKSVYGGMLVFATAQDPNRHHYPIAFGVIDSEKDASWKWFFETLKTAIPDGPELVFMSDRHASIIKAVSEVYPSSQHGHCIWHLSQNVRGKVHNVNKDIVAMKFMECAHIYTESEFEKEYGDFKSRFPKAVEYLDKSIEVDKWARCYFRGDKYNIDTSNSAESLNSVFKKARKYSLLPMIDAILDKFSEWFNWHRNESASASNTKKLVPYVENELHTQCAIATHLIVTELNRFQLEYSVIGLDGKTYLVDLLKKSCCCRCFDIDKYPCVHAIAANMTFMKKEGRTRSIQIYDLCSKYYLIETWALAYYRTIYLVPHESKWSIPDDIQELVALPPDYIKKPGRNQEQRFPSTGERRRKKSNKFVPSINLERWTQSESSGSSGEA